MNYGSVAFNHRSVNVPGMGLTIRMVLALAIAALLTLATLAGLVWLVVTYSWGWLAVLLVAGFAGDGTVRANRHRRSKKSRKVTNADRMRVERALQRLALVAGVPVPEVKVEHELEPLSWTLSLPWRKPAVHVTTGMLDRLGDAELEAVVAHELMHVVNRDAAIMTLLAAAPTYFFRGMRDMVEEHPVTGWLSIALYGLWFTPTAVLLMWTARIVSRHRELVADRGAAELIGSPAAVAGALLTVSGGLTGARDRDLRDVFHFLPAREATGIRRLWATHPRMRDRIERLQQMEAALQD
jgi:heat shock protein HtpX